LARLSRALAMDLELVGAEVSTGGFRTDIVARDRSSGEVVVIESQFGRSDHDHFGKALTYLAAHDAKSVVWIAGAFADEHRAALAWLNDHTDEEAGFFAVVPKLMRIAGSPPGLRFDVVIAPNSFVKRAKQEGAKVDESVGRTRAEFWTTFNELFRAEPALQDWRLRYGGRLGFQWLLPPAGPAWAQDVPHVLVYIGAAARGRPAIGLYLSCREGAAPEAKDRLARAVTRLRERGVATGTSPADFSSAPALRASAARLVENVKAAGEELAASFA
jgi:hypothetical protein